MIFMNEQECPKTKHEAFVLQEPLRELHLHMDMVKNALDFFEEFYFIYTYGYLKRNKAEQEEFIGKYDKMKLQMNTITLLFEECYEYIAMLCGEKTPYRDYFEQTAESGRRIRRLLNDQE